MNFSFSPFSILITLKYIKKNHIKYFSFTYNWRSILIFKLFAKIYYKITCDNKCDHHLLFIYIYISVIYIYIYISNNI